ncbi:putative pumilio homolog 10 [Panicum hallii]|nr:putative pumilio homolog 10 [Panicum hallii]
MRGAKVAAAAAERTEEKEMDLLLSEIPHVTSPQGQRGVGVGVIGHGNGVHGAAGGRGYAAPCYGEDGYFAMVLNRRDDGAPLQGGGGGAAGGVAFAAPLPVGSEPSPASGPFVGSAVPPPPLARSVIDPDQQWLANQLRGLRIGDAPAAGAQAALQRQGPLAPPPVKTPAPADVSAARGAYHGYNFGAPGSSVHQFLDQAKAVGYVAARPQRFLSDVGLDGYGGFPRGLDTSIGGFMYNRVGHGTGIGWGQGLVHPDLAESYLLSRHTGAEFFSPSHIALDVRGGPKLQYAYGVPVADNGFARNVNQFEAFRCENSLMFDGKKNMNFLERGRERRFQQFVNNRAPELGNSRTMRYENMVRVKEYIYFMAKDQYGCRYLQQKFEEGKHHVDVIFEGIINHTADLMINSFANYLVQKMLDVCDEEQRLRIIAVLTQDPVRLVAICINLHGTRAVQKLIETVTTREQIVLITLALQPAFMELVNDPNGNHVIQKCLTNFGAEENKFIYEAAAANCFDMAIHRHGCCVLQRCISSARGAYQAKLIVEICARGFELAQDPFGNYVVQYVLNLKIPSANAHLASQFEGGYVYLSKQKVSSNVVEKCLKIFPDDAKAVIVRELLNGSHFEQLLQDPYANYVIYTALLNTRGHLHNALVEAIRPHEDAIRTSPCCKRISRALSRR